MPGVRAAEKFFAADEADTKPEEPWEESVGGVADTGVLGAETAAEGGAGGAVVGGGDAGLG